MQKSKGQQQITDGFCLEMCILQKTYRGTGTIKWGQIGYAETHLARGIKVNVKTETMDDISKDLCDVNKNMKNLLDKDKIDQMEQPTVHLNKFSYLLQDTIWRCS